MGVAQLVRASDCGSEGRGFESHHPPHKNLRCKSDGGFLLLVQRKNRAVKHGFCHVKGRYMAMGIEIAIRGKLMLLNNDGMCAHLLVSQFKQIHINLEHRAGRIS